MVGGGEQRRKAKKDQSKGSRCAAQCSHVGEAPAFPTERCRCLERVHLREKHPPGLQALILLLLLLRSRGINESRQTLWSSRLDEQRAWFSALNILQYCCGPCHCRVLSAVATSPLWEWLLALHLSLLGSPSP